ncbi:LutC/YkgG family protein [Simiduia agarivorans]|uniref:LUD domain-containing protein n=1 Tax=Simiduia agarivorans (strain DSM 21679 / JCM 13881 / BCRC 17597 / SA1) TaxID=1117647 RepID=K4L2P6_SIMAS|nr:LUD domain-containing protein [Simiduia agarivorans]AFV00473.1 hypothetical protein M5M_16710 [Simiduia agarivorans SA1 = DSM 21679]
MNARENILGRLRAAQTQTPMAEAAEPSSAIVSDPDVMRFVAALEANHAVVVSVTREQLPGAIAEQVRALNLSQLVVSEAHHAWLDQLPASCKPVFWQALGDTPVDALFDQPAALTGCYAGICATGSLVLRPDAHEPRSLSLVPPVHLAVIERKNLVAGLDQLLARPGLREEMPTNLVLVSGPSKTADIQQTLAYGAHGPHTLVVFLVQDRPA